MGSEYGTVDADRLNFHTCPFPKGTRFLSKAGTTLALLMIKKSRTAGRKVNRANRKAERAYDTPNVVGVVVLAMRLPVCEFCKTPAVLGSVHALRQKTLETLVSETTKFMLRVNVGVVAKGSRR